MITSKQILIEARTKKFKDERVGVLVDALKDKNREINKLKEELDNYAYLLESKEKDLSKYKSYVAENKILNKRIEKSKNKQNELLELNNSKKKRIRLLKLENERLKESLDYIKHLENLINKDNE